MGRSRNQGPMPLGEPGAVREERLLDIGGDGRGPWGPMELSGCRICDPTLPRPVVVTATKAASAPGDGSPSGDAERWLRGRSRPQPGAGCGICTRAKRSRPSGLRRGRRGADDGTRALVAPCIVSPVLFGDGLLDDRAEVAVGHRGAHEGQRALELVTELGGGGEARHAADPRSKRAGPAATLVCDLRHALEHATRRASEVLALPAAREESSDAGRWHCSRSQAQRVRPALPGTPGLGRAGSASGSVTVRI